MAGTQVPPRHPVDHLVSAVLRDSDRLRGDLLVRNERCQPPAAGRSQQSHHEELRRRLRRHVLQGLPGHPPDRDSGHRTLCTDRPAGCLLRGLQSQRAVAGHHPGRDHRAELHVVPHSNSGLAYSSGAQRNLLEVAHRHRCGGRAGHPVAANPDRGPDRDRLQLPRLHDPAPVRRSRSHRRAHA